MNRMFAHQLATAVCAPAAVLSEPRRSAAAAGRAGLARRRRPPSLGTDRRGRRPRPPPIGHWQPTSAELRFVGAVPELGDPSAIRRSAWNAPPVPTPPPARDRRAGQRRAHRVYHHRHGPPGHRPGPDPRRPLRRRHLARPAPRHRGRRSPGPGGPSGTTVTADREPDRTDLAADHLALELGPARPRPQPRHDHPHPTATAATDDAVVAAPRTRDLGPLRRRPAANPALDRLVATGLDDLAPCCSPTPTTPADRFAAAGSPWFFTLFGRDSIWAARFALPLGTDLAAGHAAHARPPPGRAGRPDDRRAARQDPARDPPARRRVRRRCRPAAGLLRHRSTPPRCGSACSTTHGAGECRRTRWRHCCRPAGARAGLDGDHGDADGDGFLDYNDESGRGLANQGWKDSDDSVRFPTGRSPPPPVALAEVQGYAYEAALDARRAARRVRPAGCRRCAGVRRGDGDRFRSAFWVGRGSSPRWPSTATTGRSTRSPRTSGTCSAPACSSTAEEADGGRAAGRPDCRRVRPADDGRRHPVLQPARLPHRLGVAARHGDRDRRPGPGRTSDAAAAAGHRSGRGPAPVRPPPARAVRRLVRRRRARCWTTRPPAAPRPGRRHRRSSW